MQGCPSASAPMVTMAMIAVVTRYDSLLSHLIDFSDRQIHDHWTEKAKAGKFVGFVWFGGAKTIVTFRLTAAVRRAVIFILFLLSYPLLNLALKGSIMDQIRKFHW